MNNFADAEFLPLSSVLFCVLDSTGQLQQLSTAAAHLFGLTASDTKQLSFTSLLHPNDQSIVNDALLPLQQGKCRHTDFICRCQQHDASYQLLSWEAARRQSSTEIYLVAEPLETGQFNNNTLRDADRYRKLFENSPMGILVADSSGRPVTVNPALQRLFGYSEAEFCSMRFSQFTHPDDVNFSNEHFFRLVSAEINNYQLDKRYVHKNGQTIWCHLAVTRVSTRDGHFQCLSMFQDISERKQIESTLREREERFDLAVRASNDGVWDWHIESGENLVSARWLEILGYQKDEISHNFDNFMALLHPEDKDPVNAQLNAYLEGKSDRYETLFRMQHKNGGYRWILSRGLGVREKQGRFTRLVGTHTDMTAQKEAEQAEQKARDFLNNVVNNIPIPVFVKDKSHHWVLLNQAFCDFFGYSYNYLINKSDSAIFSNAETKINWQRDDAIIDNGQSSTEEINYQTRHGKRLALNTKARYLDQEGKPYIVGGIFDITDLKQKELALQERDRFLNAVAQATQLLLTEQDCYSACLKALETISEAADVDRAYIFETLPAAKQHNVRMLLRLEWRRAGIEPINDDPLQPYEAQYETLMPGWYEQLAQGHNISILTGQAPYVFQALLQQKGVQSLLIVPIHFGHQFWGFIGFDQCRSIKTWSSNHTFMLRVVGDSLRGTLARQKAEADLQQELQRTQLFFHTSMDGIALFDQDGQLHQVNRAYCQMLGYEEAEILQYTLAQLEVRHSPQQVKQHIQQIKILGSDRYETQLQHKAGYVVDVEISITYVPLTATDETGMLFSVAHDITQRKHATTELKQAKEAAEQANQSKGQFLATMSHEIRTPMNGVIGMTDLLLDTPLNNQQRDYIHTLRSSGESLLTIINDILDFSKIEAGKLALENVPFDLNKLVEEVISLFAPAADRKGVELFYQLPLVERLLGGDPSRLRQILTNLLGNAIKFTERGEVRLLVTEQLRSRHLLHLRFEIIDTGIGINKETQKRLFQPFSQADNSTSRRYGGTGLGLVIVQRLIELMNGKIGLDSTPGKGSHFWFNLPLTLTKKSIEMVVHDDLQPARILIVDDNETIRHALSEQLTQWGLTVETVLDGPAALQRLRAEIETENPFDIVLLEQQMPFMDGSTLARIIRADNRFASLKLLMMTTISHPLTNESLTRLQGYFTKPLNLSRLRNHIALLQHAPEAVTLPADDPKLIVTDEVVATETYRVLLVEDNLTNQKVAQLMLQKLHCEIVIANNGRQALTQMTSQHHQFDVVFMDCQMPEMDGFEATHHIREYEVQNNLPHTPIIALTANAMSGDAQRCADAGMDDYLSKPVKSSVLQKMLRRWGKKVAD